jgi:cobalamin synthase
VCDTIDGWYASLSKKDVYEVMKEPQIGAIGALGAFCLVLLKVAILTYLFYLEAFWVIIISLVLSRFVLYFILDLEIHEKSSFLIYMKNVKQKSFIIDTSLFFIDYLVRKITKKLVEKIGFINGDISGFSIEIIEILLLHIGLIIVL